MLLLLVKPIGSSGTYSRFRIGSIKQMHVFLRPRVGSRGTYSRFRIGSIKEMYVFLKPRVGSRGAYSRFRIGSMWKIYVFPKPRSVPAEPIIGSESVEHVSIQNVFDQELPIRSCHGAKELPGQVIKNRCNFFSSPACFSEGK